MPKFSSPTKNISKVAIQKIEPFLNLTDLPAEVDISTITVTCSFDTTFILENIGKYMQLSAGRVIYIKYGNGSDSIRTLIPLKKRAKKKKKPKVAFFNQATVKIISSYKKKNKPTNVKLFKNGSMQLTGCISIENFVEVLTILCEELCKVRAILEPVKMKKMIIKPFVGSPKNLDVTKVNKINIRMINSNFKIGFNVDRDELYQVLLNDDVECTYEPCVHACVNIKYYHNKKDKVSIFVFESGAIIITGGKSKDHVKAAYDFITKKLFDNYKQVVKTDIDAVLKMNGGLQKIMNQLKVC